MNRITKLLLVASVTAFGCHETPTTSTTQTTSATVPGAPSNPDEHWMSTDDEKMTSGAQDRSQLPTAGVPESSRDEVLITPMNQSNDPVDLDTTQAIRSAIQQDPSLSVNAKNVDVLTNGGIVTLGGYVGSPEQRATIEAIARGVVGVKRVADDITVSTTR